MLQLSVLQQPPSVLEGNQIAFLNPDAAARAYIAPFLTGWESDVPENFLWNANRDPVGAVNPPVAGQWMHSLRFASWSQNLATAGQFVATDWSRIHRSMQNAPNITQTQGNTDIRMALDWQSLFMEADPKSVSRRLMRDLWYAHDFANSLFVTGTDQGSVDAVDMYGLNMGYAPAIAPMTNSSAGRSGYFDPDSSVTKFVEGLAFHNLWQNRNPAMTASPVSWFYTDAASQPEWTAEQVNYRAAHLMMTLVQLQRTLAEIRLWRSYLEYNLFGSLEPSTFPGVGADYEAVWMNIKDLPLFPGAADMIAPFLPGRGIAPWTGGKEVDRILLPGIWPGMDLTYTPATRRTVFRDLATLLFGPLGLYTASIQVLDTIPTQDMEMLIKLGEGWRSSLATPAFNNPPELPSDLDMPRVIVTDGHMCSETVQESDLLDSVWIRGINVRSTLSRDPNWRMAKTPACLGMRQPLTYEGAPMRSYDKTSGPAWRRAEVWEVVDRDPSVGLSGGFDKTMENNETMPMRLGVPIDLWNATILPDFTWLFAQIQNQTGAMSPPVPGDRVIIFTHPSVLNAEHGVWFYPVWVDPAYDGWLTPNVLPNGPDPNNPGVPVTYYTWERGAYDQGIPNAGTVRFIASENSERGRAVHYTEIGRAPANWPFFVTPNGVFRMEIVANYDDSPPPINTGDLTTLASSISDRAMRYLT